MYIIDIEENIPDCEIQILKSFQDCSHAHEDIAKLLEKYGSFCNLKTITNFEGKTILHLACCSMYLNTVKLLVEKYGLDVSTKDDDGNTPLHDACRCRKVNTVKYLVAQPNCNPNARNRNGETPLFVAIEREHWGLSLDMISTAKGKVDVTITNNSGLKPLGILTMQPQDCPNYHKIVKELQRQEKLREKGNNSNINPNILAGSTYTPPYHIQCFDLKGVLVLCHLTNVLV